MNRLSSDEVSFLRQLLDEQMRQNQALREQLQQQTTLIQQLQHQLATLQGMLFGQRSERRRPKESEETNR